MMFEWLAKHSPRKWTVVMLDGQRHYFFTKSGADRFMERLWI